MVVQLALCLKSLAQWSLVRSFNPEPTATGEAGQPVAVGSGLNEMLRAAIKNAPAWAG